MGYRAKDGKVLPSVAQGRMYDRFLDEQRTKTNVDRGREMAENAPGGASHEEAFRLHGAAIHTEVDYVGPGRIQVKSRHQDGFEYQGTHPQVHVANDVVGHLLGVNPPNAIETHTRARAHPVGEKEKERMDREDGRKPERNDPYSRFEDFEDEGEGR